MQALLDCVNLRGKGYGYRLDAQDQPNAKDEFVAALREWWAKHGDAHTLEFSDANYAFIGARHCEELLILDPMSVSDIIKLRAREEAPGMDHYITPCGASFEFFANCIGRSVQKFGSFVDRCALGAIDIKFLNAQWHEMEPRPLGIDLFRFGRGAGPFDVDLQVEQGCYTCIEDFIMLRCILPSVFPVQTGELSKFMRCSRCSDYFIAKSSRSKWCSQRCRMADYHDARRAG